jgi:indolepyruvate ferredoxin oxidoreductase beta subunit
MLISETIGKFFMKPFNIYVTGVGGQGIGLLSEILLRAADYAGLRVKAVGTHGLAQRGGVVVSHLRLGDRVFSPLVPGGAADLVIALERHEAMRGLKVAARDGGTLVYYDTVWQPLDVRLNRAAEIRAKDIHRVCAARDIKDHVVFHPALEDIRMQNIAVLSTIHKKELIPDIQEKHYKNAMEDLLQGDALKQNLKLFEGEL